LVPVNHVEMLRGAEVKLGAWVSYLRNRFRRKKLDPSLVGRLESLNGWTWGPLPPGPKASAERDREIMECRRQGMSLQEIGDMFGLSRQRVHQIVGTK
jgi:DNA-binding NarL/FixJ family response regulator